MATHVEADQPEPLEFGGAIVEATSIRVTHQALPHLDGGLRIGSAGTVTPEGAFGATSKRLLVYVTCYVACFGLPALLWPFPEAVLLAFVILSTIMLWQWHSRSEVTQFLICGILGSFGEFVAIGQGAWQYTGFRSIPPWLPFAWACAGLFVKKVVDAISPSTS